VADDAVADAASSDETQAPATSKRTAASRAASSKAAAARGEAAKSARSARTSAAGTPDARSRAAAAASTKRQTQRVAAALTTETTTAARASRKPDESTATDAAASTGSEVDETTRERPVASARITAVAAAAAIADDAVAGPVETGSSAEPAVAESPSVASEAPAAPAPEPTVDGDDAVAESLIDPPADTAVVEVAPEVEVAPVASDVDQAVVVIPAPRKPAPRKKRTLRVARPAPAPDAPRVLAINGLVKRFGDTTAVDGISLDVRAGSFYGIVGPNGAGKTTTLSMVTGLLRPDAGSVRINEFDAWADPRAAKRATGVLPDRLRLFDRLTGAQLLYYAGVMRGLDNRTVRDRSTELIAAFGLEDAVDRLVADYSAGMTKKIALACAMIHAPRLLVLDEPFESVDPVSAANLTEILERYVGGGGTVLLSSHGMDLIERVCDSAAIIVGGRVLASGTLDEVRAGQTLEDRFVELAGGRKAAEGMEWLHSFSD
jgi:ABC-2 type transport system ATP-binding protein